ncbi:acyltransferase family protein [Segetibacter koreensis]|uniref:acyltransferase family protein n=1 Tax=Segetibacter koreensis TaxID=398037 RepID=UPI00037A25CC|nr:acyltransferase [Segetibacter koreensis]
MNRPLLINPQIGINNFDIIRFLLASAVIFCHCFVMYYGYEPFTKSEPFMVLSQGQISIGSVAVDFFFIISGFLIVRSFEYSKTNIEYLKKRILRIYPGFIVAFLISILFAGFVGELRNTGTNNYWQYLGNLHKKQELVHLFTLQSPNEKWYFKNMPQVGVNNSLWTIQFEFICYLLVPVIAFLGFFKKKFLFIVSFLVVYVILYLQLKGWILPFKESNNLFLGNTYHLPRFTTYFLSGACFYIFRAKIFKSNFFAILSFAAIAFSFVWVKCVDQVLPVAGSYLLFYTAYHPALQFSKFSKRGDYSYGLYLYGWPIQQVVMYFLAIHLNPFRFFFIAYPLVLAFAYFSWHFIEKRCLHFKTRKPSPVISINHPSILTEGVN